MLTVYHTGASVSRRTSQDLEELTELSPVPMATGGRPPASAAKPLSLDPQIRLRVEKLEEVSW